ncbi:signal peptidase I [Polaribacter cellanae]|uniref:Signal peptidase I n=1 Tax=Polaribacter cellanae TaxID=2818493 RepID=A0A975H7J5_9FLAO|nr:signal peptidase I [Polaribacter cellanae]QTE23537.1 signal peptidase I [Polaribacter cellanae]
MFFFTFFLILIVTLFCFFNKLLKQKQLKKSIKIIFKIIFILFLVLCTKLLVFDIYKIPSSSMENTLFPNDVIVVNKLKYGPRLPRSPFDIPLVNIGYYFNDNARKRIKELWWPYKRLSGTSSIKQGDVFVFNLGITRDFFVVKRCVALPGDTLKIKDAEICTNSILFNSPSTVKNSYKFIVSNYNRLYRELDSINLNNISLQKNGRSKYARAILSKLEFSQFSQLKNVESLQKEIDTFNLKKELLKTSESKWTLDNMGSIIIPKKGMKIKLTLDIYLLYKKTINKYENCILTDKQGVFYINNKQVNTYTFKQNYYFMMGDNRKGTIDSRAWGFLPESNIVGKVQCVLYSNYQDEFRWDRLLKSVY